MEKVESEGFTPNDNGLVVNMRSQGPLAIRDSYFGPDPNDLGSVILDFGPFTHSPVLAEYEAENISFCWTYPEGDNEDEAFLGGFVFEGNSVVTTNDNPFLPQPSQGEEVGDECIYPTTQAGNRIELDGWVWPPGPEWQRMQQHYTGLDTSVSTHPSVSRIPTSHSFFDVLGWPRDIRRLEDGVPGQVVVLVGREPRRNGTTVADESSGLPFPWSNITTNNIALGLDNAVELGIGDTLTLLKGPDALWYEISSSDN